MTEPEWMKQLVERDFPWMNADHLECLRMLCDLYYGFHHVHGIIKQCGAKGIEINTRASNCFATFDFNHMTRAVVMAHDRCIRFSIEPSGPGLLRLQLHKRHKREGSMYERHPTLEEHIATIREKETPTQPADAREL